MDLLLQLWPKGNSRFCDYCYSFFSIIRHNLEQRNPWEDLKLLQFSFQCLENSNNNIIHRSETTQTNLEIRKTVFLCLKISNRMQFFNCFIARSVECETHKKSSFSNLSSCENNTNLRK